ECPHVRVYFGITDETFAALISRRVGTQTVKEDRVSWGRGGRSVSRAQIKRPLMDSSAITHMDANDILILARQHQVIAQQTPWDQYQPWAGRGTQYAWCQPCQGDADGGTRAGHSPSAV